MRGYTLGLILGVALGVSACGEEPPEEPDVGVDMGIPDLGPEPDAGPDMGRPDRGPLSDDPCARTQENAVDTVGCNGEPPGPSEDDTYGGVCDPDPPPSGSCEDPGTCIAGDGAPRGICLISCTPSDSFYVTTGDCPTGSRCFDLGGRALCFPDCRSADDCATGECDMDGSCTLP